MASQSLTRRTDAAVADTRSDGVEKDRLISNYRSLVPKMHLFPSGERLSFWRYYRDLLHERFALLRAVEDLHDAVNAGEMAVASLGSARRSGAHDLSLLAIMKTSRFQITAAKADIDAAVSLGREAREYVRPSDALWLDIVRELGFSLSARFKSTTHERQISDLDEAITCCREVMSKYSPETLIHKQDMMNLGARLMLKAQATNNEADVEEALESNRQALRVAAPGSSHYMAAHHNTSQSLLARYTRLGDSWDLLEAIQLQRVAMRSTTRGDADWSSTREVLAQMLRMEYNRTNDGNCLREIAELRRALSASPSPSSSSSSYQTTTQTGLASDAFPRPQSATATKSGREASILDRIPAGGSDLTLRRAFRGALTGTPDGDALDLPGVRYLPHDQLSRKTPVAITEHVVPRDERYPGPMTWAEYHGREIQLEMLLLAMEKADGQDPDEHLCRICRRLGLVLRNRFAAEAWFKWRPFGTWAALQARGNCILCRVVVHCLSDGTKQKIHPRLQKVDQELSGVQLHSERLPTGEQYLAVEYGLRRTGVIRILDQSNFTTVLRQAFQVPNGNVQHLLRDENSPVLSPTDQCVSIQRIKAWLSECKQHHRKTCADLRKSASTAQPIPILLVDVHMNCLVRTSSARTYFALSYVWGKAHMPKTVLSNVEARMLPGSLPRDLPLTIMDSMKLVRDLGEKYLWTDALCIVQDDPRQKHQDIQQMDLVYSHAHATIVALHGHDANAGLPGVRPGTRKPQYIETRASPTRLPGPDASSIRHFNRVAQISKEEHEKLVTCFTVGAPLEQCWNMMNWVSEAMEPGGPGNPVIKVPRSETSASHVGANPQSTTPLFQAMVPHPPSLEYALRCSNWYTRGWTFQERHLSAACIYFSSDFVYFQCGETTWCETGGDLLPWPDVIPSGEHSPDANLRQTIHTNPLLELASCISPEPILHIPDVIEPYKYKRHRFDVYRDIVESYSKLRLSFDSDILNAFAGISRVLGHEFQTKFLDGLPLCYLDHSLLWAFEHPSERRLTTSTNDTNGLPMKAFPSWSWAGWTGTIRYLLVEKGEESWRRERHQYAQSEIDCFQILHNGVLLEAAKSREHMQAAEIRNLEGKSEKHPTEEGPSYLKQNFVPYTSYVERKVSGVSGPDLGPTALWFWTWAVGEDAFHFEAMERSHIIVDQEHGNIPGKHRAIRMLDRNNTHCGLIMSPRVSNAQIWHPGKPGPVEWVLISSFGDTDERRMGLPTVNKDVKPFDENKLPWKGKGSGLVNLMLVEWDNEVAERLTVAQVNRQAWESAEPVWKHVRLI